MGKWADTVDYIQRPTLLVYADADRDGLVTHDVAQKITSANMCF